MRRALAASLVALAMARFAAADPVAIHPGESWADDKGNPIQAHGGGILKEGGTFYWFGEDRGRDVPPGTRAVGCYASEDLGHWIFKGDVFSLTAAQRPADLPGRGLIVERPKVFHHAKTGKFVMYFHLDDGSYNAAEVGIAVSDHVDGPYTLHSHFRPLGQQSRDIGQFIDDDGTAYLIFEDRPNGFHIAQLSDDYLTVAKDVALIRMHMEGGALVHYGGLYYAIGSALTGWNPNPNKYATAEKLSGPWSEFKDIAPRATNTYGSQSTMLLKVTGTKETTVIFMGDIWRPQTQWDSRYLWMPVEIGDGKLALPEPREWTLDVKTGEAHIKADAPAMALPSAGRRGAGAR